MRNNVEMEARQPPLLFVEDLPYIGQVPMFFYIPKESKEKPELAQVIEAHGGRLTEAHECFTYQI